MRTASTTSSRWTGHAAGRRSDLSRRTRRVLPPPDRKSSDVAELLASHSLGLPEPTTSKPEVEPYSAKLQRRRRGAAGRRRRRQPLRHVVRRRPRDLPSATCCGNHQLVTAFQINSGLGSSTSLKDIGAQVGYFNQAHRWNWGLVGGQIPYLSSGFQSTLSQRPNGDVIQTDQLFVFRQTERSASGVVAYPFNRAQRIELQGGASQISFDQIVTTQSYSRITGAVFEDSTETTPIGETLSLGTSSAAYVFDTSVFGATSPVQGQRSRFEVSPTFGTLNFTGLLADYRRYFMPANFYTLGVRVMHYGRYGRDAQDPRIFPLYIGYPWLVRGYDVADFDRPTSASATGRPRARRSIGSRAAACSSATSSSGSRCCVRLVCQATCTDRCRWKSRSSPMPERHGTTVSARMSSAARASGVSSAGVALRVNLFGFAVGEFDVARPFQRPGRGWKFGFNLMPGW